MDVGNASRKGILSNQCPTVSVIMPVRNVQAYIRGAIASILNQSFNLFELLILDDGSTDNTLEEVRSFGDERIRVFPSTIQMGVSQQLNLGLSLARGEFIARMDGDDWCHPKRFEEQVRFLETNPKVGICGTYFLTINLDNKRLDKVRTYNTNGALKFRSFFRNPFCHPSVMFRRTLIDQIGYYIGPYAEDYDLWLRAFSHTEFYVLPKILLHYRVHIQSFSVSESFNHGNSALMARRAHVMRLMGDIATKSFVDLLLDDGETLKASPNERSYVFDAFMMRFKRLERLSSKDLFFINQELASRHFRLYQTTANKEIFYRFINYYFTFPFFDKIASAYIEQAYSFYLNDKVLKALMFSLLSFIKSPLNGTNFILIGQLCKKIALLILARINGKR